MEPTEDAPPEDFDEIPSSEATMDLGQVLTKIHLLHLLVEPLTVCVKVERYLASVAPAMLGDSTDQAFLQQLRLVLDL